MDCKINLVLFTVVVKIVNLHTIISFNVLLGLRKKTHLEKIRKINRFILKQNDELFARKFIFGDRKVTTNAKILNSIIEYILATERLD